MHQNCECTKVGSILLTTGQLFDVSLNAVCNFRFEIGGNTLTVGTE